MDALAKNTPVKPPIVNNTMNNDANHVDAV
jgi:hypothetical protein